MSMLDELRSGDLGALDGGAQIGRSGFLRLLSRAGVAMVATTASVLATSKRAGANPTPPCPAFTKQYQCCCLYYDPDPRCMGVRAWTCCDGASLWSCGEGTDEPSCKAPKDTVRCSRADIVAAC